MRTNAVTNYLREAPTRGRPRPDSSHDTEFFWEGARRHKLLIQRCTDCATLRHPPGPLCPQCHSFVWDPVEVSGRGAVYSWIVHHLPAIPGFEAPVIVVVVALEEGPRVISNLFGASPEELRVGDPVEVFFADQEEGWTAPQFRPAHASGSDPTPNA